MQLIKKHYIFLIEYIIGNIIFNLIYSAIETLVLKILGAENELHFLNFVNSFKETIIIYSFIYIILITIQIIYDKYLVNTLNKKLNKISEKKGGE